MKRIKAFLKTIAGCIRDYLKFMWKTIGDHLEFGVQRLGKIATALVVVAGLLCTIYLPQLMVVACVALVVSPLEKEPIVKFIAGAITFIIAELSVLFFAEFILILGTVELIRFFGNIVERFLIRFEEDLVREHMKPKEKKSPWKSFKEWFGDLRKPGSSLAISTSQTV